MTDDASAKHYVTKDLVRPREMDKYLRYIKVALSYYSFTESLQFHNFFLTVYKSKYEHSVHIQRNSAIIQPSDWQKY